MKIDTEWTLRPFEQLTAQELYQVMWPRSKVFVTEQKCIYLNTDNKDQQAFRLLEDLLVATMNYA